MSEAELPKENYDEAIEKYYKLKEMYEKNYNKKKNVIKRRKISPKEKRRLLQKLQRRCINCKKRGGTIFTNTNGILQAVCGHKAGPCDLHIEIKKSDWRYLPDVISYVKKIVDNIKQEIIETKLNLLFGLESEKITIQKFDTQKGNFEKAYSLLTDLEERLEISHNWKERKEKEQEFILELYNLKDEFSHAIAEYRKTGRSALLEDAIEIYIDRILPKEKSLQDEQYATMYVDKVDVGGFLILNKELPDKYILRTPPLDVYDNEYNWAEGTVIK